MRRFPMLICRNGTYYYRKSIPLSLRPLVGGRREIWKSLRTSNLGEAKLSSLRVGHEVESWLRALRKQAMEKRDASPEAVARQYERRADAEDVEWWRRFDAEDDGSQDAANRLEEQIDLLRETLRDHRQALAKGDAGSISRLLSEVLLEEGLHVPAGQRRMFAEALLKAQIRGIEASIKRGREPQASTTPPAVTVMGLLDAYLTERQLESKTV